MNPHNECALNNNCITDRYFSLKFTSRLQNNRNTGMSQSSDNIQVIGIPFSTFTRTICWEKGISYSLIHAPPHSEIAKKWNPFGKIPSFIDSHQSIFESVAIANHINNLTSNTNLRPQGKEWKVDQWISICSDYIFSSVEHGVVKPRLELQKNNITDDEISERIKQGVQRMEEVLTTACDLFQGTFVCGDVITWGDLFLLPIIADLMATPEKKYAPSKIAEWYEQMKKRPSFQNTRNGTLEADTK